MFVASSGEKTHGKPEFLNLWTLEGIFHTSLKFYGPLNYFYK